jgi:cytochrome c oxidase assembly factor CtaG
VSPSDWSWSPEALAGIVLAVAYLLAVRRLATPRWRIACFLAGCLLLAGIWVTPLDTVALHYLVFAHLWQNVVLAEWAPLLLVLGVPPALAARIGSNRLVGALTNPLVALPLWLGNYVLWHVPALYDASLRRPGTLLAAEHALYLLTGLALWWPVWQDVPHRLSSQARTAYVFAAFVLSAPLGLVLALVGTPLYDFYAGAPERLWGLSRLTDQQLGGISMASEQSLVFFAIFAYWFFRLLQEEDALDARSVDPDSGT